MNNRLLLTWAAALTLVAAMLAGALAARGDMYAELNTELDDESAPLDATAELLGISSEGMDLPVTDLKKPKGGVWNTGRIDWKKSDVVDFQGQPAIKVFYGKGSGTSRHKGIGGLNFSTTPPGLPGTSAIMSFQVYFAPGWHFSNGGKLTGFHIGEGSASGGQHSPNASSCRISFKEGGGAWMYVYPPSDLKQDDPAVSRTTGTGIGMYRDKFPPGTFKVGEWNDVKIAVKLNTIDAAGKPAADGMSYVQINDKSATLTRMRWRRSADLLIEHYNFATFFGGKDPSVKDVTAYYRNFKLGPWNV